MNRRSSAPLALALGAALGFAAAYLPGVFRAEPVALAAAPPPPAAVVGGLAAHRLLDEVVGRIQREYVDELPARAFDEAAVEGIVANLDPHSAFLDAREYDEMRATTTGSYSGVGIEVSAEDGRVVSQSVLKMTGSSEAKAY